MVIQDLYDMHVPGWLLAILCSYLSSRTMVLKYQQAISTERQLPGGYGAGTWLGGFLFIIKFNGICLRPAIPRPVTGNTVIQLKYIDDASQAASINLKTSLMEDPLTRTFPLNFNERTKMVIKPEENLLQHELSRFVEETSKNKLVVNQKKSLLMNFNFSKKYAFPPEFKLGNSNLEVKEVLKVLGVMIQQDLKWGSQVDLMTRKASKTIWRLRRMQQLGLDQETITTFWKMEGRVHLEASCPVWSGGITGQQSRALCRVQRKAVAAITAGQLEYEEGCAALRLEPLPARRLKLSRTFARRTAEKSRHQDLFMRLEHPHNTRRGTKLWREPASRTRRHQRSPLPYLTRLLNGEDD